MTMGRTVALAATLVFVSAASVTADDLSEVEDDISESAPADAPTSEPADYSRNGIYVGLGGSYGIDTFGNSPSGDIDSYLASLGYSGADVKLDLDGSLGMNGQIGYRFHPHFSAEFQFEWLSGFDGDADSTIAPGVFNDVSIEPWVLTGSLKGYLLTGRYQPYLSVGAGIMTVQEKVNENLGLGLSNSERFTDATGRFGAGIDIYVTENVLVTAGASYVLPNGDVSDFDYVSVTWGLGYRF